MTRARDVDEFERLAFPYLAAREAEHNLLFGIVAGIRSGAYAQAPYLAVVRASGRAVAAAVRTPPWNLVLSTIDDPGALVLLADDAQRLWPDLPGVLGPKDLAAKFASSWQERIGCVATRWTQERVFRLERVRPPRPISGHLRMAETADRALVAAWLVDFAAEALRQEQDPTDATISAERFIASGAMYFWDDGGAMSMTGARPVTPSGSRVGPVYTPPEKRGRGYASALVAAVSQVQLDRGRRYCFLFTDLANPTSNKIYQEIGYEPVCDVDEYRFGATAPAR
jgi:predicted GNAT family acetyltransferase